MRKNLFGNASDSESEDTGRHQNLSSKFVSKKRVDTAQDLDASVYDYDAVYDALHTQPKKTAPTTKGPKYMQGLLEAAEVRKRDQLQAKDKLLSREREAEGEQFADKEKFVTGAYKAQQEEVRKLAEEEKKNEEAAAERKRKEGGGMTGLYKDMLKREEERHAAIAQAVQAGPGKPKLLGDNASKKERDVAREAGASVNDEGQVVDKRQLLRAGLNIAPKPKDVNDRRGQSQDVKRDDGRGLRVSNGASKSAMRERQSLMLEAQLEQVSKRAADDDHVETEALKRAAKSKKTKEEVSSAKERYLQRKKEAQATKPS